MTLVVKIGSELSITDSFWTPCCLVEQKTVRLLLDSGTDSIVLFSDRLGLAQGARESVETSGYAVSGSRLLDGTVRVTPVSVGRSGTEVAIRTFVTPNANTSDVDGMLPTSAFRNIFNQSRWQICNLKSSGASGQAECLLSGALPSGKALIVEQSQGTSDAISPETS
jgi:hypothetical protein